MRKFLLLIFLTILQSPILIAQENSFDIIYNHIDNREYEEALKIIEAELENKDYEQSNLNTLLFNKGMIFEFQNKMDSAIWCYEKVLHKDSLHVPTLNSLGMLYGDFEYYDEAYELFYRLLEIDSTIIVSYSNIIYYKGLEGQYNEAITIANKTLPLTNDTITTALILNNMSFAQYNLDKLEDAYLSVTKSLNLLDDNAYAYKNLGLIYLKQGEEEKACLNFQKSLSLGGTEDIYYLIPNNCEK